MPTREAEFDWKKLPKQQCDVVMKGGITSGVVYPRAITELAKTRQLRGLGGASAGAIGAALGAAAEYGRSSKSGGFAHLDTLPDILNLEELFVPQLQTKPLLDLLMAVTGHPKPGVSVKGVGPKARAFVGALFTNFRRAGLLGILPAVVVLAIGVIIGIGTGWPLVVVAVIVLAPLGWVAAMVLSVIPLLRTTLPDNLFGICTGISGDLDKPGLTEWLAEQIDLCAGITPRDKPLTFGQLWEGPAGARKKDDDPWVDLRMVSTCLSWARPVEMPFSASQYFYDPVAWAKLFPPYVMEALRIAPQARPTKPSDLAKWRASERAAFDHSPLLARLPDAQYLPIIVSTRLSLSFPLLISAVPLWSPTRRPGQGFSFEQLWFTDGGLCNNFPVQLFDAALPTRPTFAINLGKFSEGEAPDADDQTQNIEYATTNYPLLPPYRFIPSSGFAAIAAFAGAAVDTARNSQDNLHLGIPGYRDRVVLVRQSSDEGGLNLRMDPLVVGKLAERGRVAARELAAQFDEPRYPMKKPVRTGWDNHRWVRYRALLSGMPAFLSSYQNGYKELRLGSGTMPSYPVTAKTRALAKEISDHLIAAAELIERHEASFELADLESEPRPLAPIRRVPQI